MDVRSVTSPATGPQGLDALGATAAPQPREPETPSKALEPAVKLDIGTSSRETRFIRDTDTRAIVFQVVDPGSGDVLAQLPSETALRNRAYANAGTQNAANGNVTRVA